MQANSTIMDLDQHSVAATLFTSSCTSLDITRDIVLRPSAGLKALCIVPI